MLRECGELVAGEIFTAPAGVEWLGGFEAHAWICGEFTDDVGGVIGRAVVEDDDFEIDAVTLQNRVQGGGDVGFFVTRGDEHGALGASGAGLRE